jgi:hypothetical protein
MHACVGQQTVEDAFMKRTIPGAEARQMGGRRAAGSLVSSSGCTYVSRSSPKHVEFQGSAGVAERVSCEQSPLQSQLVAQTLPMIMAGSRDHPAMLCCHSRSSRSQHRHHVVLRHSSFAWSKVVHMLQVNGSNVQALISIRFTGAAICDETRTARGQATQLRGPTRGLPAHGLQLLLRRWGAAVTLRSLSSIRLCVPCVADANCFVSRSARSRPVSSEVGAGRRRGYGAWGWGSVAKGSRASSSSLSASTS